MPARMPNLARQLSQVRKAFAHGTNKSRKELLKDKLPLNSLKDAYQVQAQVAASERSSRVGYKVANTNRSSQEFLSVPHPFFGPILSSRTSQLINEPTIQSLKADAANLGLVEPEIALVFGRDLPPNRDGKEHSFEDAMRAISATVGSVEVVHTSFQDWRSVGALSIIADLASNGAFFFSQPVPVRDSATLTELKNVECELRVNGKLHSKGRGSNALGDPLEVIHWLCNQIIEMSDGTNWIRKGDVVSTGVIVDPPYYYAQAGDLIRVEYSVPSLKQLQIKFE